MAERLTIADLPDSPLDAASQFHARYAKRAREAVARTDCLTLLFSSAGYPHRSWRIAVTQELARIAAPARVNAVGGSDKHRVAAVAAFLETAPGVTGQYLVSDGPGVDFAV
jgi:hypothetical protein